MTPALATALAELAKVRGGTENQRRAYVEHARRLGATWQQVADALGYATRWGARKRYGSTTRTTT